MFNKIIGFFKRKEKQSDKVVSVTGNDQNIIIVNGNVFSGNKKNNVESNIQTKTISLRDFNAFILRGSFNVVYKIGDKNEMKITADQHVIDAIEVLYKKDSLIMQVKPNESFFTRNEILIEVTGKALGMVKVSGSGNFSYNDIKEKSFYSNISGSGNIYLSGYSDNLDVFISGSGSINAKKLLTDIATVSIEGSGNAKVRVEEKIDAKIFGSGNIKVYGKVKEKNIRRAGSGDIFFKDKE